MASDREKTLPFINKSKADPKSPVYHGHEHGSAMLELREKGQEEVEKYQYHWVS